MAKYGLFVAEKIKAVQEFEGDVLEQNQEFVYIFEKKTPNSGREQVAPIHLAPGQSVRRIKE